MLYYAKAIIASLGTGVTAAAALVPANTGWAIALAATSAVLTTLGTYLAPNKQRTA